MIRLPSSYNKSFASNAILGSCYHVIQSWDNITEICEMRIEIECKLDHFTFRRPGVRTDDLTIVIAILAIATNLLTSTGRLAQLGRNRLE